MDFSTRGCKNFLAWLRQKLRDGVQSSSRGKIKNTQVFQTLAARHCKAILYQQKKFCIFLYNTWLDQKYLLPLHTIKHTYIQCLLGIQCIVMQ